MKQTRDNTIQSTMQLKAGEQAGKGEEAAIQKQQIKNDETARGRTRHKRQHRTTQHNSDDNKPKGTPHQSQPAATAGISASARPTPSTQRLKQKTQKMTTSTTRRQQDATQRQDDNTPK